MENERKKHQDTFICTKEIFSIYPELIGIFKYVILVDKQTETMAMSNFSNIHFYE